MKTYYGIIELYGNNGEVYFATSDFEFAESPEDRNCSNGKFDAYVNWYDIEEEREEAAGNLAAEGGRRVQWFSAPHVFAGGKEGVSNA